MSGTHVISWISIPMAVVGLGSATVRLLVLLKGLRWALTDAAQRDRALIFREFARAVARCPTSRSRLMHDAYYDSSVPWGRPQPHRSMGDNMTAGSTRGIEARNARFENAGHGDSKCET
jgi:hypothetical protein